MTCSSSYVVGTLSIALLIFDMIQHEWNLLWMHALGGLALTVFFWLLCQLIGDTISLGILVIPTLFFIVFALGILFTGKSLQNQGCCVKCNESSETNTPATNTPATNTPATPSVEKEACEFTPQLKASQLL
jgi:hypothetical protein